MPTISEGGCGTDITQGVPSNFWTAGTGENAIIGTCCSVATPTMADVAGVPAVPSRISTLSSSISLRAFLVAVEGSVLQQDHSDLLATNLIRVRVSGVDPSPVWNTD